jgi:hypothetical protein
MYLCENEKCFKVFDDDYIKAYINLYGINSTLLCSIRGCGGNLVEVDENIIEAVFILNKKGYRTVASCSGHLMGLCSRVYIDFVDRYMFYGMPRGFEINYYAEGEMMIEKLIGNLSNTERQIELWNTAKDLLMWAESLPAAVINNEIVENKVKNMSFSTFQRPNF